MANPKFLQFSTTLITRDGTSATKDSRITNMLVERKGESETHFIKRPGYTIYDGTSWGTLSAFGAVPLDNGSILSLAGTGIGTNNVTVNLSTPAISTYATFDPAAKSAHYTLSGGNLIATSDNTASYITVTGNMYKTTGKWYCEVLFNNTGVNARGFGIVSSSTSIADGQQIGYLTNNTGYAYDPVNFRSQHNETLVSYGSPADTTAGVRYSILYNGDAKTLGFWKAGVDKGTAFTGLSGAFRIAVFGYGYYNFVNEASCTINFGATAFTYTPPAGYSGWGA